MLPPAVALRDTVQAFPPPNSVGPNFWGLEFARGPILPPRGSKERDRVLRLFDTHDYTSNWQGATSGLLKKTSQTEVKINGPASKVQYYQDLLGTAHFGHGWEYVVKLIGRDYLTQSYGGIWEIAGPGDPNLPLRERPTGINHLDSWRCYVTGNPIYPLLYYSLWDGKLHRMHASRVYMMVDDPSPDERYLGIGRCALERAIAVAQRELRMTQYIDASLDDRPQPGILSLTGIGDAQWGQLVAKYTQEQNNDERPVFGRSIVLTSIDPNAKVAAQVVPFAQTPDKFDWIKYMDADLSNYALAIGVDRQELAELSGKALGSGAQSETLSTKSSGKFYGDFYAQLARFLNWAILDEDCEATITEDDTQEKLAQAAIDAQYSQIAQSLSGIGVPMPATIKLLAQVSPTFDTAFTNERGVLVTGEPVGVDNATPMPEVAQEPMAKLVPAPQVDAPQTTAPEQPSTEPSRKIGDVEALLNGGFITIGQAQAMLGQPVDPNLADYYRIDGVPVPPDQVGRLWESRFGRGVASFGAVVNDQALEATTDTAITPAGGTPRPMPASKDFAGTAANFRERFIDILTRVVSGSLRANQAENRMLGLLLGAGEKAFADGLLEGGVTDPLDTDEQTQVQEWVADQIDYLVNLLSAAKADEVGSITDRADLWVNKGLTQMYNAGRISANKNGYYTWKLGNTEMHCDDCRRLAGQVHRFKEWYARGWLPQSDKLECGGWYCDCSLERAAGPGKGRF